MLTGDNGILTRAGQAKDMTDIAGEKEILQTSALAAISKEKYGDLTKEKLDEELDKEPGRGNYSSVLADETIEVTFTNSGRTYFVNSDGNVEKMPEATGITNLTAEKTIIDVGETTKVIPTLEPERAKKPIEYSSSNTSIATVDSSGVVTGVADGTVTITAIVKGTSKNVSITVKKVEYAVDKLVINGSSSPYVNYPAKDGSVANKILCQVLYDKNSENGLQIVAVEPVTKVKLGSTDENTNVTGKDAEEKSINSYNRAIQTLNEKAEEYLEYKEIASDARCVGSNPKPGHKNDESESVEYSTNSYGKIPFKKTDTHYTTDKTALIAIGAYKFTNNTYGNYYWLASRVISGNHFDIRNVTADSTLSANMLCLIILPGNVGAGRVTSYDSECGFRPIFILNSGVKIISGSGTKDDPYEIDI